MRVRQYAFFAVRSETVPAADITARLGIEPDEIQVRGSRTAEPPTPVCHLWMVACRQAGLRVDEQVEAIARRLSPRLDALAALATELVAADTGDCVLEVVRYFDTPDGEVEDEGVTCVAGQPVDRLPGQHQLLGWNLGPDVIDLLNRTGARLDVDEHG